MFSPKNASHLKASKFKNRLLADFADEPMEMLTKVFSSLMPETQTIYHCFMLGFMKNIP